MSAASLPAVGTELGPCVEPCSHSDCQATMRMAAAVCVHCTEPIGYERPFFNVTADDAPAWSSLAHERCHRQAAAS